MRSGGVHLLLLALLATLGKLLVLAGEGKAATISGTILSDTTRF
jgi:hypothetical protein